MTSLVVAPLPPRTNAVARLVPGSVDVSGVDGAYRGPDVLRYVGRALVAAADRLAVELQGGAR